MEGRPGGGYEVRGRIEHHSGRRGQLLLATLAIVAVAWAAVTLGGGPTPRQPASTDETRASTPLGPGGSPTPTQPPAIEVRSEAAPTAPVPVAVGESEFQVAPGAPKYGSFAWLDPRSASLHGVSGEGWREWRFLERDGTAICACLVPSPTAPDAGTFHLIRFDPTGEVATRRDATGMLEPATLGGALVDVALTPDARAILVAAATVDAGAWTVRLARLGLDPGAALDTPWLTVGGVPEQGVRGPLGDVRLRLTPDGRLVRVDVSLHAPPFAPDGSSLGTWLVGITDAGLRPPTPWPDPWQDAPGAVCPAAAWVTNDTYARICDAFLTSGSTARVVVRSDRLDGTGAVTELGQPESFGDASWLIDGASGTIYGWSPARQVAYRFEVPAGRVAERTMPDPLGFRPEASSAPSPGPTPAWQATNGADHTVTSSIAASADGRLLYAAGVGSSNLGVDPMPSTGIWVIDTRTLAVVGHWLPEADYGSLGVTPDGRYVMALGGPTGAEIQQFGNHGSSLVFHDATDGDAVLVLRGLPLNVGAIPGFLVPGPAS